MKPLFITFLLFTLSACASKSGTSTNTLSKNTCKTNDWQQLGFNMATRGKPVRVFDEIKAKCSQDVAQRAQPLFMEGFQQGLYEHCTFETGFALGRSGKSKENACPLELRNDFLAGYKRGNIERKQTLLKAKGLEDDHHRVIAADVGLKTGG